MTEVEVRAPTRACGDVPLLVDDTFATAARRTGVRVVPHSATKFLGGRGDVMGGVVACEESYGHTPRRLGFATVPWPPASRRISLSPPGTVDR